MQQHKYNENTFPVNEYLLWNNCNNNCKFCNLRNEYQSTEEDKVLVCELVKKDIKSQKSPFNVLLVGGEIFTGNTKKVEDSLFDLYTVIADNDLVDHIYFNTNLLYNNTSFLYKTLDMFDEKDKIKRIHFTTSDDVEGRFDEMLKKIFYRNLTNLRETYPELRIIVNTIITKKLCELIKRNEYNVKSYCQKYKVEVNNIPFINTKPESKLCPTKEDFLETLFLLEKQDKGYIKRYCDNFLLNQKFVLKQFNPTTKKLRCVSCGLSECGHSKNFKKCFVDKDGKQTDICFGCLLKILKESVDF